VTIVDILASRPPSERGRGPDAPTGEHSEEENRDLSVRDDSATQELLGHQAIRHAVIDAERAAVLDMRDRGQINDEVWRRIERDLDVEEVRMEAYEGNLYGRR
jgi:hypothetical protein